MGGPWVEAKRALAMIGRTAAGQKAGALRARLRAGRARSPARMGRGMGRGASRSHRAIGHVRVAASGDESDAPRRRLRRRSPGRSHWYALSVTDLEYSSGRQLLLSRRRRRSCRVSRFLTLGLWSNRRGRRQCEWRDIAALHVHRDGGTAGFVPRITGVGDDRDVAEMDRGPTGAVAPGPPGTGLRRSRPRAIPQRRTAPGRRSTT